MANLFERMGLVRTEYDGPPATPLVPLSETPYAPEVPEIDASQVSYEDVISSIYQQGEVGDDNSIFKIELSMSALPGGAQR